MTSDQSARVSVAALGPAISLASMQHGREVARNKCAMSQPGDFGQELQRRSGHASQHANAVSRAGRHSPARGAAARKTARSSRPAQRTHRRESDSARDAMPGAFSPQGKGTRRSEDEPAIPAGNDCRRRESEGKEISLLASTGQASDDLSVPQIDRHPGAPPVTGGPARAASVDPVREASTPAGDNAAGDAIVRLEPSTKQAGGDDEIEARTGESDRADPTGQGRTSTPVLELGSIDVADAGTLPVAHSGAESLIPGAGAPVSVERAQTTQTSEAQLDLNLWAALGAPGSAAPLRPGEPISVSALPGESEPGAPALDFRLEAIWYVREVALTSPDGLSGDLYSEATRSPAGVSDRLAALDPAGVKTGRAADQGNATQEQPSAPLSALGASNTTTPLGADGPATAGSPASAMHGATSSRPPEWISPAQLPARIAHLAGELGDTRSIGVRLRLDPPSLGEIRVQIEATERGINVRIVTQSGEACALLSDRQSQLRDELLRSGLTLQSFAASVGSDARQRPGEGAQDARQQLGADERWGGSSFLATPEAPLQRAPAGMSRTGRLDARV
jgi:flagellar hook-length control protein FliK